MKCIYCETQLPERGFYCPNCQKQIKCKHCNDLLMKNAMICIICGETIGQKVTSSNVNTIEFSETETERTFKASFTDTVGQSISDSFGMILTNRIGSKKHTAASLTSVNSDFKYNEIPNESVEPVVTSTSEIMPTLQQDDIPTLKDIKLRDLAKTEPEWVLVYAYYASEGGKKTFTRENIVELYKDTDRFNTSRRKNLSLNITRVLRSLFIKSTNNTDYILLDKGKEEALQIFKGNSKGISKKKSAINGETPKTKKSNNIKILTDLNLRPQGKISLKDFAAKYMTKSGEELSLLIIYYLKEELKETVTVNHIYSCYKELGNKIPQHFKQTLSNQKNRKNWIDVDDWNDIKYTTPGMNYMEHDIMKA